MGPLKSLFQWMGGFFRRLAGGGTTILCDRCRYNYGNVCSRPERPNARICPDYKKK